MSSLANARTAFIETCISQKFDGGIHAVTFQPKPTRKNGDRYVVQHWGDIVGPPWLFLAVLDGHSGVHVAEYTALHLPHLIHEALRSKVGQYKSGRLNPESISKLLNSQIRKFDSDIGKAVVKLCPKPEDIDDELAQALFEGPHVPTLRRAMSGTTFTGALIDGEKQNMWVVGLGDSSAVLSRTLPTGIRDGERLIQLHNTSTPAEYARVALAHPSSEKNVLLNNRVLGSATFTRAIGDFHFKLSSEYSKRIFVKSSSEWSTYMRTGVTTYNLTPPYIKASSEARHFDLTLMRELSPILLLYTDGVDAIINGAALFRQENPCRHDPATVMGTLIGDNIDQRFMRDVFDHEVELKWHGEGNRAVELLGNILAGTDPDRLMQVLNPELLSDDNERDLYVDDTTIVLCPLT